MKLLRNIIALGTAAAMLTGVCGVSAQALGVTALLAEKEPEKDTEKEPEVNIITEIALTGVSAPVVGGNPVYTGIKVGAEEQYHLMDVTAGEYRIGGVSWSAQTTAADRTMMLSSGVFTEEKCYTVSILVEPEKGWSIPDQVADVTATVNGSPAKVARHADYPDALYISYIFKGTTAQIDLTGIAEPQAGEAPNYSSVRCVNALQYQPNSAYEAENWQNGICWLELDKDGKPLDTPPEAFELGKTYRVTVCVSGTDWYDLGSAAEMKATLNGYEAKMQKFFGGMVGVECEFKVGGQRGDYDGDGTISVGDAQKVLAVYVEGLVKGDDTGKSDAAEPQKADSDTPAKTGEKEENGNITAGDVDANDQITVDDAQYILLYYTENTLAGNPTAWNEIIKTAE